MSKKLERIDPKTVRFTAEQKLRFRDGQVKVLKLVTQAQALRNQAEEILKQAQAGELELQKIVTEIAKENFIDPAKYTIDLEALQFVLQKNA
jgi:hypothetical protein